MEKIIQRLCIPKGLEDAPGPRGSELLKVGKLIQEDSLAGHKLLQKAYGDFVFCPWPNRLSLFVFSPSAVKHVLKDNHNNYVKSREYEHMKPLLGNGLLTSNGELWRRQRKVMAKEFHQARLDLYRQHIEFEVERLISFWSKKTLLDVSEGLTDFTFRIAGKVFFGTDLGDQSSAAKQALDYETQLVNRRIRRTLNFPRSFPLPENMRGARAVKHLKGIVEKVIEQGSPDDNVLGRLAQFRDSEGNPMQGNLLRDEIMTLLLAGHETTSNALSWSLYLLAGSPKWQDELRNDSTGAVARACFQEAIRLYPPAPIIARMSLQDDVIDGNFVPASMSVMTSPWVTQRDPRYWENANEFDPSRFLEQKIPQDGRYFPFALGPRACIGESLAMLEGEVALYNLVRAFEFKRQSNFIPNPAHHVTLRSDNGVWLELKRR